MNALIAGIWLVHSWYPLECCNERDCSPVNDAKKVEGGYMSGGVFYPNAIVKPSPDQEFHACFVPNSRKPLCFFAPLSVQNQPISRPIRSFASRAVRQIG